MFTSFRMLGPAQRGRLPSTSQSFPIGFAHALQLPIHGEALKAYDNQRCLHHALLAILASMVLTHLVADPENTTCITVAAINIEP
jgi:hypothetical protein